MINTFIFSHKTSGRTKIVQRQKLRKFLFIFDDNLRLMPKWDAWLNAYENSGYSNSKRMTTLLGKNTISEKF